MADDLHFSGYENWVGNEGLPVYTGWGIHPPDLELAPWDRKGVDAAILHLEAMGDHCNDFVMEIPPGGSSKACSPDVRGVGLRPQRPGRNLRVSGQRWPGAILRVAGRSLFGIPLNSLHQHFNGSGDEPARLLSVSNLPLMLNAFHNEDFIWHKRLQVPGQVRGRRLLPRRRQDARGPRGSHLVGNQPPCRRRQF